MVPKRSPVGLVRGRFIFAHSGEEALAMSEKFGWTIKEQEPGQWRRVVPSPDPDFVMHGISIRTLVDAGTIVLAAGGGGIPVYNDADNK